MHLFLEGNSGGTWVELACGVVPLAPERPAAAGPRQDARVLLFSPIRSPAELPAAWREFSPPPPPFVLIGHAESFTPY
jgi:hypothetical protein